jgi:DNA-binding NarL/FixJ family response regulator
VCGRDGPKDEENMTSRWRVVVIDDQDDIRLLVRLQLAEQPDLEVVGEFAAADEAAAQLGALRPDVLVLDHMLGRGTTGSDALTSLLAAAPGARVVFHVGDPTMIQSSVQAAEIVTKGGDVVAAVRRAATS